MTAPVPPRVSRPWRSVISNGLAVCLGLALLAATCPPAASAQGEDFVVVIATPGEGETLYAGPAVPVYSISISGYVLHPTQRPETLDLLLEVYQGEALAGSLSGAPQANGQFGFAVTVNPDGTGLELYGDVLTKVQGNCGLACHYRAPLDLPSGPLELRVTATDPDGRRARASRRVIVDRSGYAAVPVQIMVEGAAGAPAGAIPVVADTRLYLWRARHARALTGLDGLTSITVEALAEAPTHYVFRVDPVVVGGVHYESVVPVTVTLPAGTAAAAPITLRVRASTGQIAGRVVGLPAGASAAVYAIRLPEGAATVAQAGAAGEFRFADLPVARYLMAGDGLQPLAVDLTHNVTAQVEVAVASAAGKVPVITVHDETGAPLPFAWITAEGVRAAWRVQPATGAARLAGLPTSAHYVAAHAPGYYSQSLAVDPAWPEASLDVRLVARGEGQRQPWGAGYVEIPPEAAARVGDVIQLDHGWLWGHGAGEPVMIRTNFVTITLETGAFALEAPAGESGWFYVLDGEARLEAVLGASGQAAAVVVGAGEMAALNTGQAPAAVPLDPVIITAFHPGAPVPMTPVWQPTLGARLRQALSRLGVATAQVVTFLIYFLAFLSVIALPAWGVLRRWRSHKQAGQHRPIDRHTPQPRG